MVRNLCLVTADDETVKRMEEDSDDQLEDEVESPGDWVCISRDNSVDIMATYGSDWRQQVQG